MHLIAKLEQPGQAMTTHESRAAGDEDSLTHVRCSVRTGPRQRPPCLTKIRPVAVLLGDLGDFEGPADVEGAIVVSNAPCVLRRIEL